MFQKYYTQQIKKELKAFGIGMFFILTIIALSILSQTAYADSTQQYNKIYLNPFYVNSIGAGGTATFSTTLNPPDRISSVTSAIIGFNAQINGQTQNFTLRVNGQSCNPSSYAVATAFSTTGNVQFYFDCTNMITKAGNYQINLTSSVATGALTGWIETVYMNNPNGNVKYVGGTDYWQGERATVFLQLQNSNGNAVNNASCNFDMYNTTNMLGTPIYNRQPMVFRGADGIYYYQFLTTGLPTGVYPLDAECVYNYDNYFFYNDFQQINVTWSAGTFVGGSSFNLNSPTDGLYLEWTGTPNVTYRWDNVTSNITKLNLYWMGETSVSRTITFRAWNFSSSGWTIIGSVTTGTGGSTTVPTGVDDLFTASLSLPSSWNGTTVIINAVQNGSATKFVNWMTLKAFKNSTYVTEVKGSSEVHIYPMNITDMPMLVWNHTFRNLTYYQNFSTTANFSQVLTDIAQINATATAINTSNNQQTVTLNAINTTSNSILSYLQGTILTLLNNIYSTVLQTFNLSVQINSTVNTINAKNFTPTIIVNATFNITNQVNVTVNNSELLPYLTEINTTTQNTYSYITTVMYPLMLTMNGTITSIQSVVNNIYSVVLSIQTTVNNIFNLTTEINATTKAINFTPTIIVNLTVNTTNVTLQNTTVIVNTTNINQSEVLNYLSTINSTVTVINGTVTDINNSIVPNTVYIW